MTADTVLVVPVIPYMLRQKHALLYRNGNSGTTMHASVINYLDVYG